MARSSLPEIKTTKYDDIDLDPMKEEEVFRKYTSQKKTRFSINKKGKEFDDWKFKRDNAKSKVKNAWQEFMEKEKEENSKTKD